MSVPVQLIEQHPGYGEWGQHWAPKRGFTLKTDSPQAFLRGALPIQAGLISKGDHIEWRGDAYIVSYVKWIAVEYEGSYCKVYCRYNGAAGIS